MAVWVGIVDSSGNQVDTFGADPVGLKNVATTTINPATEDKQDDIVTGLGNVETNQTDGTQQSKIKETAPTDATKVNASLSITRDGDGNITQIDKVISGTTYRKTLTWTDGELTAVSAWSAV